MRQQITLILIIIIELLITLFVMVSNRLFLKAIKNKYSEQKSIFTEKRHSFGVELALIGISLIITSFSFFGTDYTIEIYTIKNYNQPLIMAIIFISYVILLSVTLSYKIKYLSIENKLEEDFKEINWIKKIKNRMKKTLLNYFPLVFHNFIGFVMFFVASIILLNQGDNTLSLLKNLINSIKTFF